MRAYNTYMHKSGFGQNPDVGASLSLLTDQKGGRYNRGVLSISLLYVREIGC